jgi:hypothetical protein
VMKIQDADQYFGSGTCTPLVIWAAGRYNNGILPWSGQVVFLFKTTFVIENLGCIPPWSHTFGKKSSFFNTQFSYLKCF